MSNKENIKIQGRELFLLLAVSFIVLFSCTPDYTPKPEGYFRIDLPEKHQYQRIENYPDFSFEISDLAKMESLQEGDTNRWFNIVYPLFNAKIYCTYLPVTPASLSEVSEDSRKLVYRHVVKAESIEEKSYENPGEQVYGLIYTLRGNVASPIQFVLTDSARRFFRASLLFNSQPNQDSIAPVLNYIDKDIKRLIESFYWKRDNN